MSFSDRLFSFFFRPVGAPPIRRMTHPYFGELMADDTKAGFHNWEAEVKVADPSARENGVGIGLRTDPNGPTESEEQFCRAALADLDALFARSREAVEKEYATFMKKPFPANWRDDFSLDGITVPRHGDANTPWDVCWFSESAGHWFTAEFENGRVKWVIVDG